MDKTDEGNHCLSCLLLLFNRSVNSVGNYRIIGALSFLLFFQANTSFGNLTLTLTSDSLTVSPGGVAMFTGTIINTTGVALNGSDMFLNFSGVDPTFTSLTQQLGTPDFALPNNTYSSVVDLFSVQVSPTAAGGTYYLDVSVEDIYNDLSTVETADVIVNSNTVPESSSGLTTATAGVVMFCLIDYARKLRRLESSSESKAKLYEGN